MGERWDIAPAEIPRNPLPLEDIELTVMQIRGGAKDPRGALPMPVRLAPDSNPDELIYAGSLRGWHHVVRVISSEGGLGA